MPASYMLGTLGGGKGGSGIILHWTRVYPITVPLAHMLLPSKALSESLAAFIATVERRRSRVISLRRIVVVRKRLVVHGDSENALVPFLMVQRPVVEFSQGVVCRWQR